MHRALSWGTRWALLVVLITGLISCALGTTETKAETAAFPADGYGFSVGAPMTTMSTADADRELDAAARTGATWLRVNFDWKRIEPTPGAYDWGYADRWVGGAHSRGLKVLGMIADTPDWARVPGASPTGPPVNASVFADFVTKVVQRYGDRVWDWEIWNEPNNPTFFGFVDKRPERYTELLKAAYPAIKATQPHSTVVAAGLSPDTTADSSPVFVKAMYDAGARGYFDAMAMHPYVFPGGLNEDPHNGWSDVEVVRGIMVDQGDGGKKIWMTELGAPTCDPAADGVSQDEQARQITDVLRKAAQTGYSGPAFIYSIRDVNTAERDNAEDNYGALLTSDWHPKVAAKVLAR